MKNDDIKRAFEAMTPDENAKERMLKGIMEKAEQASVQSSAERETLPWYTRFKMPLGYCTAAMACAMVFTIAVSNSALLHNNQEGQQMLAVPETTTTTAAVQTEAASPTTAKTVETTVKTTAATEKAVAATTTVQTAASTEKEEAIQTTLAAVTDVAPIVTTAQTVISPTIKPVDSSLTTTGIPTELITTTPTRLTTVTASSADTTVTSTVSILPSLYGNLYDFNQVVWAGRSYATDYSIVDFDTLTDFLGSGVATGSESDATYTILVYEIEGLPMEDGFAVQYAGQTAYYAFYNVD